MQPNPHRGRVAHQRQQIEETFWWLESIAVLWSPISESGGNSTSAGPVTEADLPLPAPPASVHAWFDMMLNAADWSMLRSRSSDFDASVAGLHLLKERLDAGLATDISGLAAVEAMEVMAAHPPRRSAGSEGADVLVTSVDEALGRPSGLTVLSGLDDEAWSMRRPDLPWCDRASRVSLGLFDGDLPIRRGRHVLAQLLAFTSCAVVFDSSAEEGAGPSPPLAEWLLHVRRIGRWGGMNTRPAWFDVPGEADIHGLWTVDDDGTLRPAPGAFVKGKRDGQVGKEDVRQRTDWTDAGRDVHAPVNRGALLAAAGRAQDRARRQPDLQALETGEVLPWSDAARLQTTSRLNLRPLPPPSGRTARSPWWRIGLTSAFESTEIPSRSRWTPAPSHPQPSAGRLAHAVIDAEAKGTRQARGRPAACKAGSFARKAWLEQPSASAVKMPALKTSIDANKGTLSIVLKKRPAGRHLV